MSVQTIEKPVSGAASEAIRQAVFEALGRDGALAALLGGGTKIFLGEPLIHPVPRIEIGRAELIDFDGTEVEEYGLVLNAFSQSQRDAHLLAGALLQALDDAPLALPGHRLVGFRFAVADIRREADGYRAIVRFRAVTEPANEEASQ